MILITRVREDSLRTQEELSNNNVPSLIEPLMTLKPYLGVNIGYRNETIIVTSTNAIRSLMQMNDSREYRKIIAIGGATAKFTHNNGFNNVILAGYNVQDLMKYVLKFCEGDKLLYISGEKISYPLCSILSSHGMSIRRVIIYDMVYNNELSEKCYNALLKNKITGVTFFSLNTAQIFIKLIFRYKLGDNLRNINAYTLSNNITNFLSQQHWKKIYTSDMATHNSLMNEIYFHHLV